MALGDAYQDSTDSALNVMASLPPEADKPANKWSAWTAPFRGVAGAIAETAGNVLDTAAAFGQVAASAGGVTPGFDPDADRRHQESVEAMEKIKSDGIDWRTEASRPSYEFSRDLRPDPLTAGTAENLVYGLSKGLTKAVGSVAALGPAVGAVAFGAGEGVTAAEDLAAQGVDPVTRAKVGAVTAAMNTIGVALPVAGQTLTQTAGLVIVGGPGSFMAQQAATQSILRGANYGAIAEQYDPFDPVGLALATLLPAGFAAYAKRGGFAQKPMADGQPIPDTAPAEIAATPEAMDAAMVQNLTAARDLHGAVSELEAIARADIPPADLPVRVDLPEVAEAAPAAPDFAARIDQLLTESPDLVSRLDDAGQPVRLADDIAELRRVAQEGTDTEFGALDAPLLQVAAECALSFGGVA